MFKALQLFLFMLPCLVGGQTTSSSGNNEQCGDSQLEAYKQCVQDNACQCANCDPDPMDDYPVIRLNSPPESCQDVNRLFCPMIRCCSVCEDVALDWYSCAFRDFSVGQLGTACPQVCSAFAFGDVEGGDCQPTIAPAPTTLPPVAATALPTQRPTDPPTNAVDNIGIEEEATAAPTIAVSIGANDEAQVSSVEATTSTAVAILSYPLGSSLLSGAIMLLIGSLI